MKIINIIVARKAIQSISDQCTIVGNLGYWLNKFMIKTQDEASYYAAEMKKLFEKYGTPSAEHPVVIPKENVAKFHADMDVLNNQDVEDPSIKFGLSELSSASVPMKEMRDLMDFIDETK